MTADEARTWLIKWSLIITGAQMVFLAVCPAFGYPLEWPKNLDLLQIVAPVFVGYLGSAAHFIFMTPPPTVVVNNQLLPMMLKGPVFIYALFILALLVAFGYSNRVGATLGNNMSPDNLTNTLAIALGFLALTTGVISSYLFAVNATPAKLAEPKPVEVKLGNAKADEVKAVEPNPAEQNPPLQ